MILKKFNKDDFNKDNLIKQILTVNCFVHYQRKIEVSGL